MGRKFLTLLEDNRNIKAENIEQLSGKINKLDRKVSQWDFYNIQSVVRNKGEFASTFSKLLPNSALVIDAEGFSEGNDFFNRGDIVYKATNLEMIHINAERGGMFFPSQIKQLNSQYLLKYKYSTSIPIESNQDLAVGAAELAEPHTSITFTGLTQTENDAGYNLSFDLKDVVSDGYHKKKINFNKIMLEGKVLQPYIKLYMKDIDNSFEEVSCDFRLDDQSVPTQYQLTVPDIVTHVVIR